MVLKTQAKRLTGNNPLAYIGVDPLTPNDFVINPDDPTTRDNNFSLGTIWLNEETENVFMLTNLDAGVATWTTLATSGTGPNTFITDSGNAVPSAGDITIAGGSNINTSGASSTVTINLDNSPSVSGSLTAATTITAGTGLTVSSLSTGVAQTNSSGVFSSSSGTDGQLLVSSSSGAPAWANITAGSNITITNGANSITIAATPSGGGLTWSVVTGATQTISSSHGYFANNAGTVTFTLPATASVGDTFVIAGMNNATGWTIAQRAGQTIHFAGTSTTTGVGGSLSSSERYDVVELVCNIANTDFVVTNSIGNITIV